MKDGDGNGVWVGRDREVGRGSDVVESGPAPVVED